MSEWQPIGTAPKDGSVVYVKRVYEGQMIKEGIAVFDIPHEAAPMRQSLGPDPLGRLSSADYAKEAKDRTDFVSKKRWLNPDRMYCFPTPTHWIPSTGKVSGPGSNLTDGETI